MRTQICAVLTVVLFLICGIRVVNASEASALSDVKKTSFTIGTQSGEGSEYTFLTDEKLTVASHFYVTTSPVGGGAQVEIAFQASNGEYFKVKRIISTNGDFANVTSDFKAPSALAITSVPGYIIYIQETQIGSCVKIVYKSGGQDYMLGVNLQQKKI